MELLKNYCIFAQIKNYTIIEQPKKNIYNMLNDRTVSPFRRMRILCH